MMEPTKDRVRSNISESYATCQISWDNTDVRYANTERLYCDLTESPFGDWYEPVEGYLVLPHGPGLSIDPDQGILDKLRVD